MTHFGVCMISTYFYPWAGGAEKQAERLSRWLIDHDIPVMMVTRHFDNLPTYEKLHGIEVYRVRPLPGKILGALSFVMMGVWIMLKNRNKYSIIHSHQVYSPTTIGWIASKLLGRPLVVNLHLGGAEGDIQRLLRNPTMGHARLNILKRDAGAFVAISREIAQEMREQNIPEEKIHFLVNAVDPTIYAPVDTPTRDHMRQQLDLPAEVPIAFFGGRLVQIKGVQDLLKAWNKVPEPAYLVIAGTGELESELQAYAQTHLKGRVKFVGKIDNVDEYLQATDAWVLPSYGEGLPVSLLEAMATTTAIVTTPVGAIPEIIKDGENGLLVPSGDVDALTDALTKALSRSDAIKAMGISARQLVMDKYSLHSVSQSYKDLFEKLLQAR